MRAALGAAQADLARQAQLAGTVGSISGADLSRVLQGAQQYGNLGQTAGQLTSAQQGTLANIGQTEVATRVHNAWLRTIEDGVHTGDIYHPDHSTQRVGTSAFADAVVARLGEQP